MAPSTKTPLQSVVGVICDCLTDLSADDQARALEAVRVTLGLRVLVAQTPKRLPSERALPLVQVEMVNDRPMVVGQPMDDQPQPGRNLVVITPGGAGIPRQPRALRDASARQAPRQLPAPIERATPARGYVRSLR